MDSQKEQITWKWIGPRVEHMGRRTTLWVWKVEGFEYRVLRVHPPNIPVQYGAMGPRSEWSCAYIPDLGAAMLACEMEFVRAEKELDKKVEVASDRYTAFWEERKVLANLSDESNQAREFHPGQPVPISWFPERSRFVYIEGRWKGVLGEILGVNQDWTMRVQTAPASPMFMIENLPMDYLVSVPNQTILQRRMEMEVLEKDARNLFVNMGWKAAEDERVWPGKRILGKLNRLQEYTEEMSKLTDQHLLNLAVGVCKALKDGVNIVLTEGDAGGGSLTKEGTMSSTAVVENVENQEGTHEGNGEGTPKKVKTPKAPKAKKEPKEPKAPKFDLDGFGCRVGSENAKFNEALTTEPQTMGQVVKKAGLKRGLYGHVKQMIKKGKVKETKQGEDRLFSLVV